MKDGNRKSLWGFFVFLFIIFSFYYFLENKGRTPKTAISEKPSLPTDSNFSQNTAPSEKSPSGKQEYESSSFEHSPVSDSNRPDVQTKLEQAKVQKAEDSSLKVKKEAASKIMQVLTGQSNASDGISREKLLDIMFNKELPIKDRRRAAWNLSKTCDAQEFQKLRQMLQDENSPRILKATILEALGYSADPAKKEVILSALENEDELVVRGAIRGLSVIGDEDSIKTLENISRYSGASDSIKSEAIYGLGRIDLPDAYETLVAMYSDSKANNNSDLQEEIISALGQRDISETREFFLNILKDNSADVSLQTAVVGAVGDSKGNKTEFLLNTLYDKNNQVRAEAAWGLAMAEEPANITNELQNVLINEQDSEVRKRLYQALGNQETVDIDAVVPVISSESDIDTKIAGYDLLAKNIDDIIENKDLKAWIDKTVLPELREAALKADKLNTRLSAVITLKKMCTEESFSVLDEIAAKSTDSKVINAVTK